MDLYNGDADRPSLQVFIASSAAYLSFSRTFSTQSESFEYKMPALKPAQPKTVIEIEKPDPVTAYDSNYEHALNQIEAHYSELAKFIPSVVLLDLKPVVFHSPNMTGWSKKKENWFWFLSPFQSLFGDTFSIWFLVSILHLSAFTYYVAFFFASLFLILGITGPSNSSQQSVGQTIFFYLFLILALVFVPFTLGRWVIFFQDRRYPIWFRLIWFMVFIGTIGYLFYFLIYTRMGYTGLYNWLSTTKGITNFLLIILIAWLPFLSFIFGNFWDLLFFIIRRIIELLDRLFKMHQPVKQEKIRKLVSTIIPKEGAPAGESWCLKQLSTQELQAIRQWAEANRDGTEKRITPTLVTVAVIGIFSNTDVIKGFFDTIIQKIGSSLQQPTFNNLEGFGLFAVTLVGFIFVTLFVLLLINLFDNLIIQSIIIEACTVAQFAKEEAERTTPKKITVESPSIFERVVKLLLKR